MLYDGFNFKFMVLSKAELKVAENILRKHFLYADKIKLTTINDLKTNKKDYFDLYTSKGESHLQSIRNALVCLTEIRQLKIINFLIVSLEYHLYEYAKELGFNEIEFNPFKNPILFDKSIKYNAKNILSLFDKNISLNEFKICLTFIVMTKNVISTLR